MHALGSPAAAMKPMADAIGEGMSVFSFSIALRRRNEADGRCHRRAGLQALQASGLPAAMKPMADAIGESVERRDQRVADDAAMKPMADAIGEMALRFGIAAGLLSAAMKPMADAIGELGRPWLVHRCY